MKAKKFIYDYGYWIFLAWFGMFADHLKNRKKSAWFENLKSFTIGVISTTILTIILRQFFAVYPQEQYIETFIVAFCAYNWAWSWAGLNGIFRERFNKFDRRKEPRKEK